MPVKKKLIESTKSKITRDKNCENVPHLEITEVVLIHSNIVNNEYQQDTFVPKKAFGQLLDISPKKILTQNFRVLKYGLVIKFLKRQKQKRK